MVCLNGQNTRFLSKCLPHSKTGDFKQIERQLAAALYDAIDALEELGAFKNFCMNIDFCDIYESRFEIFSSLVSKKFFLSVIPSPPPMGAATSSPSLSSSSIKRPSPPKAALSVTSLSVETNGSGPATRKSMPAVLMIH